MDSRRSASFATSNRRIASSSPWGWADGVAEHVLDERARQDPGGLEPGSTRVVVTLQEEEGGTRLTLRHHDLPTGELRDAHRVAWQTYVQRLAIRAAGGDPGPDPDG